MKERIKKIIKEYYIYVVVIVVVLLIKNFVASPIIVNGDSMYSTLHDGDIMILNKIGYSADKIERFDIVVVKYEGKYIIKRVIGLPGDEVEYVDNVLYINGEKYDEDYLDEYQETEDLDTGVIPENCYFVLGDNRLVSLDSRKIGCVSSSDIVGHATFTLYPFSRFGSKE